jgi:uncharacterized protein (DUF1499 family)
MISDFPLAFASFSKIWKPNQCLALPPGFVAKEKADIVSPIFSVEVSLVYAAWLATISAQPRTSGLRQADGQIEVIQKTALLGFPDWITAQPIDLGNGSSSICVFSRSKLGIRDMGVNQKRVRDWLDDLSTRLKA